ncbi:hypothetical protein [Aquimarina agarivorans]|uniref:hypothetical protein n=1 Tax=Aquimarina agarivorans TaxID=980584 RepID=UPI000248EC55|nr:hypothetical protein [Aquimarina agarivorans]
MEELLLKTKRRNNQKLSLKKVAIGSTFDIFQWKKPSATTNEYEISINGKKSIKKSDSSLVLFSCPKSNFNEGENKISVKVLSGNKQNVTDELKFNYSFLG